MSSGLVGEAFVLLGATGEVSASPPQVAMDSTSPIVTQTPRTRRTFVPCIARFQTCSTMSDLELPHGLSSTEHDDAGLDAHPTTGGQGVQCGEAAYGMRDDRRY